MLVMEAKTYIFRSKRLGFRSWMTRDLEPFSALNADPCVMEHFPDTLTELQSNMFAQRIKQHFDDNGYGLYAVDDLQSRRFTGFIGFNNTTFLAPFTPCVEIGWRLAPEYWNKGMATEGALACLDHGFTVLGFDKVYSFTAEVNLRSIKVMERIGLRKLYEFRHPGIAPEHRLCPHVLYYIDGAMHVPSQIKGERP